MASSSKSSSSLSCMPIYGASPVINIPASQFRFETKLRRKQVTPQNTHVQVTKHSTLSQGVILKEYCFSSTSVRNQQFVTKDATIGINLSPPTDRAARFNVTKNNINHSPREGMNSQTLHASEIKDDVDNVEGDGRTHSLPYRKYGPYICPMCNNISPTSQHFAAHVSSHYKNETPEQKNKRIMTKIMRKRKSLHLLRSIDHGLPNIGDTLKSSARKRYKRRVVQLKDESVRLQAEGEVGGHDHLDVPPGFEGYLYGPSSSGVTTIKAEPGKV